MECEILTVHQSLGALLLLSSGHTSPWEVGPLPFLGCLLCANLLVSCVSAPEFELPGGSGAWGPEPSPRHEIGELGDWRADGQGRKGVPDFGVRAGG